MEQTLDINDIRADSKIYICERTYFDRKTRHAYNVSRHDDKNYFHKDFKTLDEAINFLRLNKIELIFEVRLER